MRKPNNLKINPQSYDIEANITSPDSEVDLPSIYLKLGDIEGETCITKKEAKALGKWFLKLAEYIK